MRRERMNWQRRAGVVVSFSLSAAVLAMALCPRQVAAESLLLNPSPGWNGLVISGSVRAGWRKTGSINIEAFTSSSGFVFVNPSSSPLTPGQVINAPTVAVTTLPTTGTPKDKAQVTLDYSVTVGAAGPGGSDKFNFEFFGETSAVNAQYDFGGLIGLANVDAIIAVDLTIMTSAPVPASTMASIGLPSLPTLTTPAPNIETLAAKAKIGPYGAPTTVISMGPGYAGSTIPLVLPSGSDSFEYKMSYLLVTPYGTDPSVSYALEGSMERSSVPEIGLLGGPIALLIGAAGLLESRRRPRRDAAVKGQSGRRGP